ncbi:Uncharacterised protein [Arthrobacter agilis]|nr:Uncharacterised protein [Arthrobacter agilis]
MFENSRPRRHDVGHRRTSDVDQRRSHAPAPRMGMFEHSAHRGTERDSAARPTSIRRLSHAPGVHIALVPTPDVPHADQADPMDIVRLLTERGGSARARDLVAAGASGSALTRACRQGDVVRVVRGVYALSERDEDALTALRVGAHLTCISAAVQRGLWVLRAPGLVHVAVDHGRPLGSDRLRRHRWEGPVSALTFCVHAVRCLPELDALCIVESAVVLGQVRLGDLRTHADRPRARALRTVVELIDPHAQSILETAARYLLVQAGFTVASQVHVPGVGRIDLFVDGVLGIEVDGRHFHSDRREFEEDRRRWNLLTARGIPILRVTRQLLLGEPGRFVLVIRAALAAQQASRPKDSPASIPVAPTSRGPVAR